MGKRGEKMSESSNQKDAMNAETTWRCSVCGFIFTGRNPPKGCPKCGSPSREFIPAKEKEQLTHDGGRFEVLLINGSSHRAGNTGYLLDLAEEELRVKGISYLRFNLSEHKIHHCWCCYSVKAEYCRYPCRNSEDDMPAFHELLTASRAVIVASPINWNNLSARLKDFLDRTTCLQNLFHLKKPGLTEGKIVGILVCGHEDGAIKTAMDIFLPFEQMGYILAPFGISYRTHGAEFNSGTDAEFFRNDALLIDYTKGVVHNVIELMKLDIEEQLKGRLIPVSE
jgi:multimeric flavodoxin WrbA